LLRLGPAEADTYSAVRCQTNVSMAAGTQYYKDLAVSYSVCLAVRLR
jgi:hypothetical protein